MALISKKLNIAEVVIELRSKFPLRKFTSDEIKSLQPERFMNFFYQGNKEPDILIEVEIVKKISLPPGTKDLFITYHPPQGSEDWRLCRYKNKYIYYSALEGSQQAMYINDSFDRVTAYFPPTPRKGMVWTIESIIYDFLQVLLISYFAQRGEGIFTHAVGIKDSDAKGLLFAGESESGKSTTARLWYKEGRAMILNDDRIIVRKRGKKFVIHGSPWHGDFNDYLFSRIESAPLSRVFFLRHFSKNMVRKISPQEAFLRLYPLVFPTFWDARSLRNILSFCQHLVNNVPCLDFGFVKDKSAIDFVRHTAISLKLR